MIFKTKDVRIHIKNIETYKLKEHPHSDDKPKIPSITMISGNEWTIIPRANAKESSQDLLDRLDKMFLESFEETLMFDYLAENLKFDFIEDSGSYGEGGYTSIKVFLEEKTISEIYLS